MARGKDRFSPIWYQRLDGTWLDLVPPFESSDSKLIWYFHPLKKTSLNKLVWAFVLGLL